MPRPKKETRRDADAATIQHYFDLAMELKAEQRARGAEISSLNSQMQDDGVDPGVLSLFCRIASMPEGKAALYVTLLDYYKQALASRLPNLMAAGDAGPFGKSKAAA
jgi:hypothetical protein